MCVDSKNIVLDRKTKRGTDLRGNLGSGILRSTVKIERGDVPIRLEILGRGRRHDP